MTTGRINQVTTVTPGCPEGCEVRPQINRAEQFAGGGYEVHLSWQEAWSRGYNRRQC